MNQLSNTKDGRATTVKTTFSRETSISSHIQASPEVVWSLLTNGADFPRWNSTVVSLEGEIRLGETIKLKSTLDESRTFNLTVKEFEAEKRLVWGDRQGSRVYTIERSGEDGVRFSMSEKIGGLLFPLLSRMIPPFDEAFEQFTADLKQEAETISNA